ncbi:MAG TPA: hypothetical protein VN377_00740 [Candidatus Thermoplasmatota archaeon]|nr:hypothetical protein [Candidatus Thermoplasmatota archaeon]
MKIQTHLPYVLLSYLFVVLLLQIEMTLQNIVLASVPFIVLLIGLVRRKKYLGMTGMFLFYLIALLQLRMFTINENILLILELVFFIIPSLLLLQIILQLDHTELVFKIGGTRPLLIAGILIVLISGVFILLVSIFPDNLVLLVESTQQQIIFLGVLTLICGTPLLMRKK